MHTRQKKLHTPKKVCNFLSPFLHTSTKCAIISKIVTYLIKKLCNLKRRDKNQLEKYVADAVLAFLSDEKNQKIIADDTVKYYSQKTNEGNIKSLEKKISEAKKKAEELTAAFIVAKNDLLRENIETQMNECEIYLKDLAAQLYKLKLERGHRITEEIIIGFIQSILKLDMDDKNYQKIIIDNLVYRVVVYDDNYCLIDFNLPGVTQNHKNIDKSCVNAAPKRRISVPTQSLPPRQIKSRILCRVLFFS